jgi:CubicO group peptidase (beta-lactamase class C family)
MRRVLAAVTAPVVLVAGLVAAAPATAGSHRCTDGPQFCAPSTVLHPAAPERVGLDPEPIAAAVAAVRSHEVAPEGGHALYPGAVGLMGSHGTIVERDASGFALRWATDTQELPREQWVPMREDTIFDLASVSKLFTSITVVQLVEEGRVRLDAPVATYLPEFAAAGKESVTVQQLLTHTSGFTSWLPLYSRYPDKASRIKAVMDQPLTNPPGTTYLYSDLNMITLGVLVERLRGRSLDRVVAERVTGPLRMHDTGYNPRDRERTAATEYQVVPARGMVWGEVHDENAWSLGGVAGHAGVFSTADDLAVLAQALLNGGAYKGKRILRPESVTALVTNVNQAFPGDDHGLGFELNQAWYMDDLAGPRTAGHTGYTGTSIVIDFETKSFAILLTNRVHPSRSWGSINVARQEWAHGLAEAMATGDDRTDG